MLLCKGSCLNSYDGRKSARRGHRRGRIKMATDVVFRRHLRRGKSATSGNGKIYRQRVTKPDVANEEDVNRFVAEFAMQMNDRVVELSSFIRAALEDEIPELRGDARTIELLGASVEGNVDTLLHALRHDIAVERVEAPTAALEYARRLAQHGVPVNALVRAYRLGQRPLKDLVFQAVREPDISPAPRLAALEAITTTLFEYIDWISQQVVAVYEEERERWLENQNSIRALRVREVVAGKAKADVDAKSDSIRYPLRWHHLAVVMWYSGGCSASSVSLTTPPTSARTPCSRQRTKPPDGDGSRTVLRRPMPLSRSESSPESAPIRRAWQLARLPPASTDSAGRIAKRRRLGPSRSPAVPTGRL